MVAMHFKNMRGGITISTPTAMLNYIRILVVCNEQRNRNAGNRRPRHKPRGVRRSQDIVKIRAERVVEVRVVAIAEQGVIDEIVVNLCVRFEGMMWQMS